jgi:2-methylcitrate dehydratase PrpD
MADETRQLAEFILDLGTGEIPEAVRARLRCLVLDNVAAGYLGSRQSCHRIAAKVVRGLGSSGASPVFGRYDPLDISRAALLNGVAIGAFECDHTTFGAHAGGVVFPAVLALAHSLNSSGDAVMRALVAGYEVNARVAAAQTNLAEQVRGFHNPGISGTFASAAACGLLLELSLDQMLAALGIAGSSSAGLVEYVWTGAMTKRLHEGRAAQLGLESALLAQQGFTGPPTVLEGEYGYLQAFSPTPIAEKLVDDLGTKWVLGDTRVKPYPGHGTIQPFAPILDAWRQHGVDPAAIEEIRLTTSEQGSDERFHDASPDSVLGAQYSMPFMTAVSVALGSDGLIELNEESMDSDNLRVLASKVSISSEDRFRGNVIAAGGEIEITVNGESELLVAPGIPKLALPELWSLCAEKLERYARGVAPDAAVHAIESLTEHLEQLNEINELSEQIFSR